jgi:hypothetical protein
LAFPGRGSMNSETVRFSFRFRLRLCQMQVQDKADCSSSSRCARSPMDRGLNCAIRISCRPAPLALFTIHGPPSHLIHPSNAPLGRNPTTFIPITIWNSIHSVKSLGTVKTYRYGTRSRARGEDSRSRSGRFAYSHAGCHFYQFHDVASSSTFSELRGR